MKESEVDDICKSGNSDEYVPKVSYDSIITC